MKELSSKSDISNVSGKLENDEKLSKIFPEKINENLQIKNSKSLNKDSKKESNKNLITLRNSKLDLLDLTKNKNLLESKIETNKKDVCIKNQEVSNLIDKCCNNV